MFRGATVGHRFRLNDDIDARSTISSAAGPLAGAGYRPIRSRGVCPVPDV